MYYRNLTFPIETCENCSFVILYKILSYYSTSTGIVETPIVVTWVTFIPTNTSQVQYWLHGDPSTNKTAMGYSKKFVDPGEAKIVRYIHRVWIATTVPTQMYGMFRKYKMVTKDEIMLNVAQKASSSTAQFSAALIIFTCQLS